MRVKLTAKDDGLPLYVETENILWLAWLPEEESTVIEQAGLTSEDYVQETPEEIEQLERKAILDRNMYIQENKEKHWTESLHENVKQSNNDILEQVKMLIKGLEKKVTEQQKEIDKLKKPTKK